MTKKRYLTYFFFFISIIMLVVPVIPHHHHANGLICMKNDIATDCCDHQADKGHCCCNTGCVATHFFQKAPSSDDAMMGVNSPWVFTLHFESLFNLLSIAESEIPKQDFPYFESLHGTFITCATGLRAPPCVRS